jgi:dTDP-4-amino-4,6-dideoxygalactose transaminase
VIPLVNLKRQHTELAAELQAASAAVFSETAFIGGAYVEAFERDFARMLDHDGADQPLQCVGVSSGTSALSLLLEALGVGAGDEVIVPTHTFAATAESVLHVGATPVFADIETASYTLSADAVRQLITPRTKAVVPVHIYGTAADLDQISAALPKDRVVHVIEDTAQGHLGEWRGRKLGAQSSGGTFSFYPGKNLGACGDAGAVTVRDPKIAQLIRKLRDHGRMSKYEHDIVGYNHRMDGLQGAFLSAKLPHLAGWTARRQEVAARYDEALRSKGFKTVEPLAGATSVYHLFVVEVSNRSEVLSAMEAAGIATGIHYPVPLHQQLAFKRFAGGSFPATESVIGRIMSLPICPHLTDEEQGQVIGAFLSIARP